MVLSKSACDSPANSPMNHKIFFVVLRRYPSAAEVLGFCGFADGNLLTFGSESPNIASAMFLGVWDPVLGYPSDQDENYEKRRKVVIPSAIIRRKQALPGGG